MKKADIDRIATELGCELPDDYRTLLERDADELARAQAILQWTALLWTDADEILKENLNMRRDASDMTIGSTDADQEPLPQHYLVVGTNGGGDYWFVDVTGTRTGLWF